MSTRKQTLNASSEPTKLGSLYYGVYKDQNRWCIRILHKGKECDLGSYQHKKDADKVLETFLMKTTEQDTKHSMETRNQQKTIQEPQKTIQEPQTPPQTKEKIQQPRTNKTHIEIKKKKEIELKVKEGKVEKKSRKSVFWEYKREKVSDRTRMKIFMDQQRNTCNGCFEILLSNHEIDHILPLHLGGSNDIKNLQALCPNCHRLKTQYLDTEIEELLKENEKMTLKMIVSMQKTMFERFYPKIYKYGSEDIKKEIEYRYEMYKTGYPTLKDYYFSEKIKKDM
jgi:5-methylcytosine-specific restriction endonuclease McrA